LFSSIIRQVASELQLMMTMAIMLCVYSFNLKINNTGRQTATWLHSATNRNMQGFFVTVCAVTAYWHLFFQVKKKQLFVMYIVNE